MQILAGKKSGSKETFKTLFKITAINRIKKQEKKWVS